MPKYGPICKANQNQALWAYVWAENGPETAETWVRRQKIDGNRKLCLKLFSYPGWPKMPLSHI
jgi:hypothetical protein